MRIITLLLLAATPAFAQPVLDLVSTTPTLTVEQQARADAALITGIETLLAGKRSPARQPFLTTLDIAAPPADVAQLKAGDNLPVFQRWLASRSAVLKARAWDQGARWNQLLAAYTLANAAKDEAMDANPLTGETFSDVYFFAYTLAMAGETDRATAFVKLFLAAADPQFEIAFAADIAQRVASVDAWGGVDKPRAASVLAWALTQLDRPGARATDQLRRLHHVDGEIRRMSGDIAGARVAYARARKPGAPLDDAELALMFEAGETDAGLRAVQQSLGETPGSTVSRKTADKLVELTGQTGSGNAGTIAILRLAVPAYRRLLKPDDKVLENAISTLAGALADAGDSAQAEPLLAELFTSYERRFGFDSGGANQYAIRLADAIAAQSRYDEADLLYRRLWALVERYKAYGDTDAQRYAQGIVAIQLARGDLPAAEAFNTAALARARTAQDADKGALTSYLVVQAGILALSGKLDPAEAAAREAVALGPTDDKLTISAAFDNPDALARAQLASLLEARGKAAQAEPIRRLLLRKIEEAPMLSWEGDLRPHRAPRARRQPDAAEQARGPRAVRRTSRRQRPHLRQRQPAAARNRRTLRRALLRAGRAGDALTPARAALAARTASRFTGDTSGTTQTALARRRREAARLMVEAAWKARSPN